MNGILAICHQIGGARAVGPVIRRLEQLGHQIKTVAYDLSAIGFAEQGIVFQYPAEYKLTEDVWKLAQSILEVEQPQLVLTGTSSGKTLEKAVLWHAKRRGIRTVSVLDFWSNYLLRFEGPEERHQFFPECLAIMDETAREDLVSLGFDPERLTITGQPYFDDIPTLIKTADRTALRYSLGAQSDECLVLFASEPQKRDYGKSLGYTEIHALRTLLETLEGLPGKRWRVLVKPHPTESAEGLSRELAHCSLKANLVPEWPPRQLMLAADAAVGMTSMFLIESALLGCTTISLQPGLNGEDDFIGQRLGITTAAYTAEACRAALVQIGPMESMEVRSARGVRLWPQFSIDGQAAERVAEVVRKVISKQRQGFCVTNN